MKQVEKRALQSLRNRSRNSKYKTILKKCRKQFAASATSANLISLQSAANKAARKRAVHFNKASRIISIAMKSVQDPS